MSTHIVIVRTGASIIDITSYNCQEFGLARALARRGKKVSLIMAGNEQKKKVYTISGHEFTVYYLPVRSIDIRIGYFVGIKKLLEILRPTLLQVHDMGIYMSWWVSKWAKRHGVPCYLIQGVYQLSPKPIAGIIDGMITRMFGRRILKTVERVGCKSYMASNFVKNYYERETSLVYIGLDESKFENDEVKDWRKELGIVNKKVLLYVGKMESRRNPNLLINIVAELPDDYVLIMVGKGLLFEQTKAALKEKNLMQRVFMLGKLPQHELPSIYAASDLFLLASTYEIYGMVIMESMYFGVPVLSSHSGGAEIIIENNVDGLIEDSFDKKEWVRRIVNAFEDRQGLSRMGGVAKQKIKEHFVWDKSVESFLQLYNL